MFMLDIPRLYGALLDADLAVGMVFFCSGLTELRMSHLRVCLLTEIKRYKSSLGGENKVKSTLINE